MVVVYHEAFLLLSSCLAVPATHLPASYEYEYDMCKTSHQESLPHEPI